MNVRKLTFQNNESHFDGKLEITSWNACDGSAVGYLPAFDLLRRCLGETVGLGFLKGHFLA